MEQKYAPLHHQSRVEADMLRPVLTSRFWRVAAPSRSAMRLEWMSLIVTIAKRFGRPLIERGVAVVRRCPAAKPIVWHLVSFVPGARAKLEHFVIVRDIATRAAFLRHSLRKQPAIERAPPVTLRGRAVRTTLIDLMSEESR
jgi:hypothetical protein